ncbi:chymotrypsinogen A-like [Mytilus trossulus]|uniref:chymotrypsinogen A-like n=1 Tax=Mytilus trossulus TaxID=6551 RepID=UPI00300774A8
MYRVFIGSVFVVFYMATVSTAASVKIVNGDDADIEDHPWMVSFQLGKSGVNFTHKCGGAIIDKSWVLTARHCNLYNNVKDMQIAAGSSFLSQMTEIIPVKKYYMHEIYGTGYVTPNDLMLLELQKPLKFGSTINKIDLDTNVGHNYTGEVCTIAGWGDTDVTNGQRFPRGILPDRLQVQYMPAVSKAYCNNTWNSFFGFRLFPVNFINTIICLQDKDKDSCIGDSGGPMVCSNKLVGTLSFGKDLCDGTLPSVHTRISAYLDWIKDKINKKNNKNKKDKKKKKNDKAKANGRRKGKNNKNK